MCSNKCCIILFLIVLPLLFTLCIGYPLASPAVRNIRTNTNRGLNTSNRCYAVNDWNGYLQCLTRAKQFEKGGKFIGLFAKELFAMHPLFPFLFSVFFAGQLGIVIAFYGSPKGCSSTDENTNDKKKRVSSRPDR